MFGFRGTVVLPVLVALLVAAPARAHSQRAPLAGLDDYIAAALKDWEVPGLAIAVVHRDSVIYAKGFGVRTHGEAGGVDEHTLFPIASTTQALTVAALGMLVDEGRIRWDDDVARHLPAFLLHDPFVTRQLTVRDLLTHRSGVARNDELWIAGPFDRTELLRRARFLPTAGGFREAYAYHNVMYIAAGELVAAVAGTSWDDFIEQRLFQPLGMVRSTTRAAVVEKRANVASSHTRADGRVIAVPRRNYDNLGGAGAAFSSAHDMAQWIRLHLGDGVYRGQRLLAANTLREMHTPQIVLRADTVSERMFPATLFRSYGLGWNVQDYHGRRFVHHSGNVNYTRTQVGMIPGEGIGVVVIANLSSSNLQLALTYRVLDALLGLPPRDYSAEYLALARRSDEQAATQRAARERERAPDTRPSVSLDAFAGRYTSDLMGELRISHDGGRLVLDYSSDHRGPLEHWHHNTFRVRWNHPAFGTDFVTFTLDARGRVAAVQADALGSFLRRF